MESNLARSGVKVGNIKSDKFIQDEDGIVQTKKAHSKVYKEGKKEVVTNGDESK
jgi:small subunit ribosomal protein S2